MPHDDDRPLTIDELVAYDEDDCVGEDLRPWGHVNEYAYAFQSDEPPLVTTTDFEGVFSLRGRIMPGVPLVDEEESRGIVFERTLAERLQARELRHERRLRELVRAERVDGSRPRGTPIAYLPRTLPTAHLRAAVGTSARGGTVDLSTVVIKKQDGDNHSTIIDGESREFLRPTFFPYTAVCKLELWQPDATGTGINSGTYASGFLVGRRTLMTSGHAFEGVSLSSGNVRIRVIPACWANRPVFGLGLITWVRRRKRWHSDSGNDLQLCQLADPIGDSMGYFGARVYDSDWEGQRWWTMAGFPYDQSKWAMSVQFGIAVRDDDDGDDINLDGETYDTTQVENDADEASGASGGPLFGWFGKDNPCAIGVHSGSQTDGTISGDETWACAAGGDALPPIVHWGRRNWD
jgi:hypothetical protein